MKVPAETQNVVARVSRSERHSLARLTLVVGLAVCAVVGPLCVVTHAQEKKPDEIEEARKKRSSGETVAVNQLGVA